MLIKINPVISISRQREVTTPKPLTKADRIKGDRLVMLILFLLTIAGVAVFA